MMTRTRMALATVVFAVAIFALLPATPARAGFILGDAANYGLLYEGNGGKTLSYNNSFLTGNIGIGGTGQFQGNGPGTITGNIDFSAANTGQFSNSGLTITGSVSYNVAAVTSALNTVNTLSHNLGLEAGTATTISSGGSVNASGGTLDGGGNRVFTVTSVSFPNGTFTVNGAAADFVVFNIPFAASLNGSIALAGGITSDQVLFNFTPVPGAGCPPTCTVYDADYASLSGGPTMTLSTNGLTTAGVFLDPTGDFQVNHSEMDGRIFGGDTKNSAFVSGAELIAPPAPPVPPSTNVPEPGSLVLLGAGLVALGIIRRLHRPAVRSRLLSGS